MKIEMKIKRNDVQKVKDEMRRDLAEIVARVAHDLEAIAKSLAPVMTGFLRNSIQAIPQSVLTWVVAVAAEYGVFVEFGTVHTPARPFLFPAFERVRPVFERELATALR